MKNSRLVKKKRCFCKCWSKITSVIVNMVKDNDVFAVSQSRIQCSHFQERGHNRRHTCNDDSKAAGPVVVVSVEDKNWI